MIHPKKPTVSIILPTHNRAQRLKQSIKSILHQTYPDFELIVIDDASTDKTAEVVKSFKDKRISYFRQQKNRGAAAARNVGLKKARAKLIAFNDDDDIWDKRKLEKQVKAFTQAEPKIGVVYVGMKRIKGNEIKYFPEEVVGEKGKKEGNIQKELYLENFIGLPTAVIRKECFEKVGLFDEALPPYGDWELFLRISQHFYFKYLPQTLVESPILSAGLTSKREVIPKITRTIFQKHRSVIEQDKQILAAWQFRLGDLDYRQQRMKKARSFFFQAFKNKPTFKYFRAIIKTILGKQVSEAMISAKIKLLGK